MVADYLKRNRAVTRQLAELVERLSAVDLAQPLGDGWTVKAALAHLAFWDRLALAMLDGWLAGGFEPVTFSPRHVNAAALSDWLELPAEYARREVIAAAEALDRRLEAVTPELAEAIVAGGRGRVLDRTVHRLEHVDQIVTALGR